jgi:hypothetical protein
MRFPIICRALLSPLRDHKFLNVQTDIDVITYWLVFLVDLAELSTVAYPHPLAIVAGESPL